ncbi:MAG: leucine--tRNA ligase [Chloroflexi bacterium]|nr:leucine--tRNA ligase [Chloroflexota bacterium]
MADKYIPQDIEPKWQKRWEEDKLYKAEKDPSKEKWYYLTMFPYPSGDLHMGHWYAMTPSDAHARYFRMRGYNVMFPMGFDAFGLPAENAAIKRGIHPKTWTYRNIDRMRKQLRSMGAMFDWDREVVTCDPEYYKWNQWFFLKFLEKGLAYRKKAPVDWCPTCKTTLAREQVIGEERVCERCGTPVIKRDLEQWFFKITAYAEELLDFSKLDWPEPVIARQRNWIGRSEGAEVYFTTEQGDPLPIFTTRPDTLWGVTFMVLAPEHPLVEKVTTPDRKAEVEAYVAAARRMSDIERESTEREKTGVFTGGYAINPVNGERVPIWIADYVLMTYGTGAIMAVPAHDQRDFEFAKKYGLPIRVVIAPPGWEGEELEEAYTGEGIMVNSGPFDGTPAPDPAIRKVTEWLEEQGIGKFAVNYRLRDWLISRQRYWGTPIPVVYCEKCGIVPVPEEDLPVILPEDVEFKPTGVSPLTYHEEFLHTTCPKCGGPALRETDTMDTFVDSSWYQYRYLSPHYDEGPWDPQEAEYWLPVDQYTGGIEHATLHLLYTRFFTKALRDLGLVDFDEPMIRLYNQGIILGEPREGDFVVVEGEWESEEANAFHAVRIRAIRDKEKPDPAVGPDFVQGEVYARDEVSVRLNVGGGRFVIVHVDEGTVIDIPDVPEATVMDLIYHLDAEKMSKSKGNVVAPDELVAKYGTDTVRAYLMFAFRWEQGGPWNSKGIEGTHRWLHRVWNLLLEEPQVKREATDQEIKSLRRKTHQTIKRVTQDMEEFAFNTAIAALMELTNLMMKLKETSAVYTDAWTEARDTLILLMAPFTPHIAEELWVRTGHEYSVHQQSWPTWDEALTKEEEITLVVQVNGKVRAKIPAPVGLSEEEAKELAFAHPKVQKYVSGKEIRRVIFAQGRILNIVVGK